MSQTMRALFLPFSQVGPDFSSNLKFEAGPYLSKLVDEPSQVEEDEVLIRVKACNLNMWDTSHIGYMKKVGATQLAMGHGFSGEVAKVGASVHLWLPGREVMGIVPLDYNRPACASLVVVNQYDVVAKPASVSHAHAAGCLEDALKAYTALLYQARLRPNDRVFVPRGATAFGSVVVQLATHCGGQVITTAHSEDERCYLESLKLDIVVLDCVDGVEPSKLKQLLAEECYGMGVDIIVDQGNVKQHVGDAPEWEAPSSFWTPHLSSQALAVGGRLVTQQANLPLEASVSQRMLHKCASVSFLFAPAWLLGPSQMGRYQHILLDVAEKLRDNIIRPNIHHTVPFSEVTNALEQLHPTAVGSIVALMR